MRRLELRWAFSTQLVSWMNQCGVGVAARTRAPGRTRVRRQQSHPTPTDSCVWPKALEVKHEQDLNGEVKAEDVKDGVIFHIPCERCERLKQKM